MLLAVASRRFNRSSSQPEHRRLRCPGSSFAAVVVLVGVSELVGVVAGWRVAHRIEPPRLKRGLAVLLVVLGPYLALS